MNPPVESTDLARKWLLRLAENIGDPHAGRMIAEKADELGPRVSGPSRARQRATAKRDTGLRRLHKADFANYSARAAAAEFASHAARYLTRRLRDDRRKGMPPPDPLELIVFNADEDGVGIPSKDQIAKILASG